MNVLERDYYTIEAIELMPEASQRDLAKYTGMSLGKVNYCLKELAQKGWIKAQEIQPCDGSWAGLDPTNGKRTRSTGNPHKANYPQIFSL